MRKKLVLALAFTLLIQFVSAQSSSLKGSVVDDTDKKNLQNTLISLMRAKDSVLVKFARADKAGNFTITNLKEGEYIVMITHPYLSDYFDKTLIKPAIVNDLGKINMIPKSKQLAEAIIESESPSRNKATTTVTPAASSQEP